MRQGWDIDETDPARFGTFVGVVPTIDAKIAETFDLVRQVHSHPCVLLDGDVQGRTYFDAVKAMDPPPKHVVFWPDEWAIENVIAWIAAADRDNVLPALGEALGLAFASDDELIVFLLEKKSYAPTHETVAVTLMANDVCRERAARLLGSLSDILRGLTADGSDLFENIADDSTQDMQVFKFNL
jgi:hypothetical protein